MINYNDPIYTESISISEVLLAASRYYENYPEMIEEFMVELGLWKMFQRSMRDDDDII